MIRAFSGLFRLRLALLNGVTALAGCSLFPGPVTPVLLVTGFCGVALLAMGGSAINQVLERDIDAVMVRTMGRPLPDGRLSVASASAAGACAALAGLALLTAPGSLLPPLFGAAALLWYLAVYTPLKRITTLALPLGALCGAFPPLIGWSLAGGEPTDFRILILAGLFFIWQIPHFWLLQERHEADYRRAGIPLAGTEQIPAGRKMLFLLWLLAFVACAMLLPALNIIERPASFLYVAFPVPLVFLALRRAGRPLFICLNLFPLLVTLILLLRP